MTSEKSGSIGTTITAITGLVAAIGAIVAMFVRQPAEPMAEKSYEVSRIVTEQGADEREALAEEIGVIHGYLEGREELIDTMAKRIDRLETAMINSVQRKSYGSKKSSLEPLPSPKPKMPSLPKPTQRKPAAKKLPEWSAVQQHKKEAPLEELFAEQTTGRPKPPSLP